MADELTICAVAYKSRTVLESNWTLTATLNPHTQFRWLVVENSPEGSSQRIEASGDQWTLIPGGNYASPLASYASYNHAYGLHRMRAGSNAVRAGDGSGLYDRAEGLDTSSSRLYAAEALGIFRCALPPFALSQVSLFSQRDLSVR